VRRGEAFADDSPLQTGLAANASPFPLAPRGTKPRSLNALIQNFKAVTSRKINTGRETQGIKFWQRDYYEHIIRNERDLERIRKYIIDNPMNWLTDDYNPMHS